MTIGDFREAMSGRTDADLIKMITLEKDQFEAEAIRAAEEELKRRNLSSTQFENVQAEIRTRSQQDEAKANEPLPLFWKILAFLIPAFINIIFSGGYTASGYDRKAHEMRMWTLYGVGFYALIVLILYQIK